MFKASRIMVDVFPSLRLIIFMAARAAGSRCDAQDRHVKKNPS